MKRIDVAIAIIRRGDQILVCQRKEDDSFGGYWEFPGGKLEPGETLQECIVREIREELNIQVLPLKQLASVEHTYDHVQVRLFPFICDHQTGEPQLLEVQAAKWITANELPEYRFPAANQGLIAAVIKQLADPND